ncbi:tetratricopeptide repeat protein [Gloeothece verrucosa]|uniref:TPR repeat-containing protein n=1 Tax=Gloeothece verrucosa (strain PCC 7822) TaxID=497965 RepID=E0UGX1_GLOV7|nr:tetratricopeptide repeat protein [Gloeothece verrucosa]ADN14452.1 TPR repeat-containing protein [Gloeothece verrucosa PCC 7822]
MRESQDEKMNNNAENHPLSIEISLFYRLREENIRLVVVESEEKLRISVKQKAQEGDYSGAIALLDQLIESHPESAIDYNNRGLMYFWQGQFFQAIKDYNQAIELNKKLDQAYNNRANCYMAQGNWAEALTDYETAIDLNPANMKAWLNQGITLRELGLYDLALENFDLTLTISHRLQGRIYAERGYTYYLRGDWNCAIADYHRALSALPLTDKYRAYRQKVQEWLNQLINYSATG